MNVLAIVAHPDDEVIGVGGTLARHVAEGCRVGVVYLADGVSSRAAREEQAYSARRLASEKACGILGIHYVRRLRNFSDNQLDDVPLLQIVRAIEPLIDEFCPDVVYTHHGGDLNIDHRLCHQAVITACRPQPGFCVRAIRCFETRSATEWATPEMGGVFVPNFYADISAYRDKKRAALRAYAAELREPPHSRSLPAIEAQAVVRGAEVGLAAAEAFQQVRAVF